MLEQKPLPRSSRVRDGSFSILVFSPSPCSNQTIASNLRHPSQEALVQLLRAVRPHKITSMQLSDQHVSFLKVSGKSISSRRSVPSSTLAPLPAFGKMEICAKPGSLLPSQNVQCRARRDICYVSGTIVIFLCLVSSFPFRVVKEFTNFFETDGLFFGG